jgi:small subunit ribosomal protein S15
MKLTIESKQELFKTYGGSEKNTGSTEAQIALFTHRINHIAEHLKTNHKDHANTRALLKMVGRRRRLLSYLAKQDLAGYRKLIGELGIRK